MAEASPIANSSTVPRQWTPEPSPAPAPDLGWHVTAAGPRVSCPAPRSGHALDRRRAPSHVPPTPTALRPHCDRRLVTLAPGVVALARLLVDGGTAQRLTAGLDLRSPSGIALAERRLGDAYGAAWDRLGRSPAPSAVHCCERCAARIEVVLLYAAALPAALPVAGPPRAA